MLEANLSRSLRCGLNSLGFVILISLSIFLAFLSPSWPAASQAGNLGAPTSIFSGSEITVTRIVTFERPCLSRIGSYDFITMKSCGYLKEIGKPKLPTKNVFFLIPPAATLVDIEVTSLVENTLGDEYFIFPAQPPLPTTPENRSFVAPDPLIYKSSGRYPKKLFSPTKAGNLSGHRILAIRIFPVQYVPKSGEIIFHSKILIKVTYALNDTAPTDLASPSREFSSLVKKLVLNPESGDNYNFSISESSTAAEATLPSYDVKYVIITSEGLKDNFQVLADWKTKKGVPAKIVTVSWVTDNYPGADNQEKIRNFIKDAAENWGTIWVLLGGDTNIIPDRKGYGSVQTQLAPPQYVEDNIPVDLYYSDLDGDWDADGDGIYGEVEDNVDLYPDVFVGRAPVDSAAEAQTFVEKTLRYERNPSIGYQTSVLFLAEKLDENTDEAIAKDIIENNYIPVGFSVTKLYESSGNLNYTTAMDNLNSGYGIVNHAGHANYSVLSIGSDYLYRSDMDSLTNSPAYSVFYCIGCNSAAMDMDSIGEHFVLSGSGGGPVYVGNSREGWYWPGHPGEGSSDRYDQEFFNSLFVENFYRIGETLAYSKIGFIPESENDGPERWLQYALNLLGDPELPIWTEEPENLIVTHPSEVLTGPGEVTVTVKDNDGNAVENALVCLQKDPDVYTYGYTGSGGEVAFNISPISPGSLDVTVTKHNFLPYENTLRVVAPYVYLTWATPDTAHTINVSWRTDENYVGEVRYDNEPRGGDPGAYSYGAGGTGGLTTPELGGYIHHVELTGLEPDTIYYFICGHPDHGWSGELSFRTAPDRRKNFRFVAGGDSRDDDRWDYHDYWPSARDNVSSEMAGHDPSFVLFLGDYLWSSEDPPPPGSYAENDTWDNWLGSAFKYWRTDDNRLIPQIPVIGNHEIVYPEPSNYDPETDATNYYTVFNLPGNERWYALSWGPDLRIIVLDSEVLWENTDAWQEQLESELENSENYLWKVAAFHRPIVSSGGWNWHGRLEDWGYLFTKYGVDVVFQAHIHWYDRTYPIDSDPPPGEIAPLGEGVVYLVSGGWGGPLSSGSPQSYTAYGPESIYHFMLIDVLENGMLNSQAIDQCGTVFDEFSIYRGVEVTITPSENSGLLGENVNYEVTVRNTGNVTDSYELAVEDNAGWSLTLDDNLFENVAPDENRTATLSVVIPENAQAGAEDNITVTVTSQADPSVTDDDGCLVRAADLGSWVAVSYSPDILNYAVAVTGAEGNIYIANSSTNPPPYCEFWRYNPADNSWDNLAVPKDGWKTVWAKNGTCLTWDNGDYIYALFGGSYGDTGDAARYYFYRYSISGDSWEQLENTLGGQGAGDAITWVPGSVLGTHTDWIYAIVGSKEGEHGTSFWRYNVNNNSWQQLPYNPNWSGEGSDDGSSLVWAGGDYLYALQGEWHETNENVDRAFARFNLTDNTWDDLLDIPEAGGVSDGGSLIWVGGSYSDNIYALGGGYVGPGETPGDNFYCYRISGNSWTQLDSLPHGITDQNGPRLCYANENIYCWRGYYNASEGDPDVLWAYAVPGAEPENFLFAGWNLVSFPVASENDTPDNIFAGQTYHIWKWDAAGKTYVSPPSDEPVELGVGYWIYVDHDKTVRTSGIPVENYSIDLVTGWNLVGFPVTNENTTPDNLFASQTYYIWKWDAIEKKYVSPFSDEPVELGVGYWIYVDHDKTVTVPL